MDPFSALHPPQDPKQPKKKVKSIFEDDALLIEKGRDYLQLYQEWQNTKASGTGNPPPFVSDVATKLGISETDAAELMEFALSPHYGEFELDYIHSHPHTSIDLDGNEAPRPFDPFRWRAMKTRISRSGGYRVLRL